MPIVVPAGAVNAPPPVSATSADGVLSAQVDATYAGVLLHADFSAGVAPYPKWIRFLRGAVRVRSGDPARSPGASGIAYDHEAPLGVQTSWTAVPIYADESEGTPSDPVTLTTPAVGSSQVWIKSTVDPGLSMLLDAYIPELEPAIAGTFDPQVIPGAQFMTGPLSARVEQGGTLTVQTDTPARRRKLRLLLDAAPLFVQIDPTADIDDLYCIPGATVEAYAYGGFDSARRIPIPLVPIARPPTIDAPLYIPGNSNDTLAAQLATYDDVAAAYASYDAIVGVS